MMISCVAGTKKNVKVETLFVIYTVIFWFFELKTCSMLISFVSYQILT